MANAVYNYIKNVQDYYGLDQPAAPVGSGIRMSGMMPQFGVPVMPIATGFGGGYGNGINLNLNGNLNDVRQMRKEQNEEDRASKAAVIGGIAAILLSALGALTLRNYCNNRDELKKAEEFKKDILPVAVLNPQVRVQLTTVLNEHIHNLETKCARSRNIAILTGCAFLAGAAAFIGGMFAIQALITAAIIAAVAIACVTAFLVVWHCTDKTTLNPETQRQLEILSRELRA